MIDKLTAEQEARIPFYQNKWREVGFNTDSMNMDLAESVLSKLLEVADMRPSHYIRLQSPLQCQIGLNLLGSGMPVVEVNDLSRRITVPEARKLLKVDRLEYHQIGYFYQSGNTNAGYCAFYDFLIEEVKPIDKETMKVWNMFKDVTMHTHYYWVTEDVVFLCDRPSQLHFRGNLLHNVNGPAVEYRDGYSLYLIEGVRLPKEFVLADPKDIDPVTILRETNAETRMAMMQKVGADRLLDAPGVKVIEEMSGTELYQRYPIGVWHQHGDVIIARQKYEIIDYNALSDNMKDRLSKVWYKLVSVPVGSSKYHYLQMRNASIDHVHTEGVPNTATTIFDALKFRNKLDTLPYELS